ncbi:MAG: class I SAM-dependent methyltransferase [Planctomycetota bacterium]|nr:class I SAM-dependent methyltransferase [Planctomycetota bacterium]
MTTARDTSDAPWWDNFFDDEYAAYGLSDFENPRLETTADFLVDVLALNRGDSLFDQCCGVGRVSIPLAARGVRVIGLDLIDSYVEVARHRAAESDLPCTFHCGDAHAFIAPEPCDAAINWYTSFGYDEDDAQNIRVLQCAFDSLKQGGRFALDYHSTAKILADFRETHVDRPGVGGREGLIVLHENEADFARGVICGTWTAIYPDGRRVVHHVETRMYLPHEIIAMLRRCGFVEPALFGSVEKIPFDRASPRCIVTARKP